MSMVCSKLTPQTTTAKIVLPVAVISGAALLVLGILSSQGIILGQLGKIGTIGFTIGGSLLPIGGLMFTVLDKRQGGTYKIVTWNVGTDGDFMRQGKIDEKTPIEQVKERRLELMKAALETPEFQNADIILLQEADRTFGTKVLEGLLPGYTINKGPKMNNIGRLIVDQDGRAKVDVDQCAPIIWRADRFEQVEDAPEEKFGESSLTVLRDKRTHLTFAVASGYIRGFDIKATYERAEKGQENHAETEGDNQLKQIAARLEELGTDVALIGMDANTTWEHYPQRLNGMGSGFVFDHFSATTYDDANLEMAVKLDHIGVSTSLGRVHFRHIPNPPFIGYSRNHTQSPGDHAPVIAEIEISF